MVYLSAIDSIMEIYNSGGLQMITTHSSFQLEMDTISSEIKEYSKNIYIEEYVTAPKISLIRLQLFNLFLYHAGVSQSSRKVYCVSSGLIQMGLDLHETITNNKELSDRGIQNRQLSVLAGDYYSSKYYFLLAKNNLTEETKKLAIAIRNINIAKMRLYTVDNGKGFDSIEQYIDLILIRDSDLYTQFINLHELEEAKSFWNSVIKDMILLFSLADEMQNKQINQQHIAYFFSLNSAEREEKKDLIGAQYTPEIRTKVTKLYHKYNIKRKIEDTIQNLYDNLNKKINELEDRVIQGELLDILNQFSHSFQIFNSAEKI